jgi:hypothetical protein
LTEKQRKYLELFSETRRMKRDISKLPTTGENATLHTEVGLTAGTNGEYFVGGKGFMGQERDDSIVDYNCPPSTQPGLWCQWVPNEDGTAIEWDGGEKFYSYVEWLEYIIKNFLKPWGYTLNGEVTWFGEERSDIGVIIVDNNKVTVREGTIVY